ncbi:MAG: class I SAM-dependent methyltransferase [Methanomicrobiales archaeon]|nr:class I SAM-dependent methyltransferase [Methanomicrobiales archaeon]
MGKARKVIGIDADEEAIGRLRREAERLDLPHLTVWVGKAEDTVPLTNGADLVFFGICFHDFEDPSCVLQNARSMLKYTGILIDLDWKDDPITTASLRRRYSRSMVK